MAEKNAGMCGKASLSYARLVGFASFNRDEHYHLHTSSSLSLRASSRSSNPKTQSLAFQMLKFLRTPAVFEPLQKPETPNPKTPTRRVPRP